MGPSDAGGLPEAFMLQMLFRVALQQQVGGGLSEQLSKLRPPEEGWCLDWQALLLASAVMFCICAFTHNYSVPWSFVT